MTIRDSKTETESLKLLVESGVIDRKATLDDLVRLSISLEATTDGEAGAAEMWQFIVKGKFIWKDDSKAVVKS